MFDFAISLAARDKVTAKSTMPDDARRVGGGQLELHFQSPEELYLGLDFLLFRLLNTLNLNSFEGSTS